MTYIDPATTGGLPAAGSAITHQQADEEIIDIEVEEAATVANATVISTDLPLTGGVLSGAVSSTSVTAGTFTRRTQTTPPTVATTNTGVTSVTLDALATDMAGTVTYTSNASPVSGQVFALTFHTAKTSADYVVIFTTPHSWTGVYCLSRSTTGFIIQATVAPSASATGAIDYLVIG
jgi:hypothetical protein